MGLFLLTALLSFAPAAPPTSVELHPELCEASAAVKVDATRFLIADNETHDRLFWATVNAQGQPHHDGLLPLPSKRRPRDIEALAIDGDNLAVVGSFSRRKDCSVQPKRMRIRWLRLAPEPGAVPTKGDGAAAPQVLMETAAIDGEGAFASAHQSVASCLGALFVGPPPEGAFAVCAALSDQGDCPATNIEGAVYDDAHRLWLGLRAPLSAGEAMLLRLASDAPATGRLRFDAVARIDLSGDGIRELVSDEETLRVVAGPPGDSAAPVAYRLHTIARRTLLTPGARIDSRTAAVSAVGLPPSTEALLVAPGALWGITDGSGKKGKCEVTSQATRVVMPSATGGANKKGPSKKPAPGSNAKR